MEKKYKSPLSPYKLSLTLLTCIQAKHYLMVPQSIFLINSFIDKQKSFNTWKWNETTTFYREKS